MPTAIFSSPTFWIGLPRMFALRWSNRVIAILAIGKGESPAQPRRCALARGVNLGTISIKAALWRAAQLIAGGRRLKGRHEGSSQPCFSDRARPMGEKICGALPLCRK
jgi:hypothetical protein